jgi:Ras family protein T1
MSQLAESATFPSKALPKRDDEPNDMTNIYMAAGGTIALAAALAIMWKKSGGTFSST